MLDIHLIEHKTPYVLERLRRRHIPNIENLIATLLEQNSIRKKRQTEADRLAHALKRKSKEIPLLAEKGAKEEIERAKAAIAKQKTVYKALLERLKEADQAVQDTLCNIPNLPDDGVPIGKKAEDNTIVRTWSPPPPPQPAVQDMQAHWDLAKQYQLISFEQGNKVTGAGFPVYIGRGAQLKRALIQFFLDAAAQSNYTEYGVPLLVNASAAFGTGQLPDKEGMMYKLSEADYYLIPTAEVPLTNLYRNVVLDKKELPIKMVAYTPCFRREAGSWGRHVRGLNRLHQFDKVEIVQITTPQNTSNTLERMYTHVQKLLEKLQLPYRILRLCTGDLGFSAAITYDFEVWSAGQKQWLEVSSVSAFGTYQARRMALQYTDQGQRHYCATLNGSALALPRIIAALLENNQTKQGIHIPPILHAYAGFSSIE